MIVLFAGPTIDTSDVTKALPSADVRAPARTGDIYQACQQQASAIGLIDGFFEGVPSVWHKEILWALDQGIPVFGASSMGALRAAELHVFGMTGIGRVFEAYRDGALEDDDEVALRHGPQELGYVALSEPMVNIRASLDSAVAAGVVEGALASEISALAKAMYFPDRTWENVFAEAKSHGVNTADLLQLRSWLKFGCVDQKHLDALEMLSAMARMSDANPVAFEPDFEFQHTAMWKDLTRALGAKALSLEIRLILDLLRREPDRYQDLRRRVAAHIASDQPQDLPQAVIDRAVTRFRKEERLFTGAALEAWLAANDLDLAGLQLKIKNDLQLTNTIAENFGVFCNALVAELRAEGSHEALSEEAFRLSMRLQQAGFPDPTPNDLDLAPTTLLFWFFEDLNGMAVPNDLEAFMLTQDFADRSDFERMMARAFVLWQDQG
jgi:hypothetical protein